jgi:ankyrin repeat protein
MVSLLLTISCETTGQRSRRPENLLEAVTQGDARAVQRYIKQAPSGSQEVDTALLLAAKMGRLPIATDLLKKGARVRVADPEGMTALHWAVTNGWTSVVDQMLSAGADINAQVTPGPHGGENHEEYLTPLHLAALRGDEKTAALLVARGANVNAQSIYGFEPTAATPLHVASEHGYTNVVSVLLINGDAKVDLRDSDSMTPLHYAALGGYRGVVEMLLANGADVNSRDAVGYVPLHFVAMDTGNAADRRAICELFASRGAAVEPRNKFGWTPLHEAATREVAEWLVGHGANVDSRNNKDAFVIRDATPLHTAAMRGYDGVVEVLLSHGAQVDARDGRGWEAIHHAADNGSLAAVRQLIIHGAAVDARTYEERRTPLHMAALWGNADVADYLLSQGADATARDTWEDTPLHLVARLTSGDIADAKVRATRAAKALIAHGAVVDARNKNGKTPMDLAVAAENDSLVTVLKAATSGTK